MNRIKKFHDRLKRIGIDIELTMNYPWIYLEKVNGIRVESKFQANHGFCCFIMNGNSARFSDRREVFKQIRRSTNLLDA